MTFRDPCADVAHDLFDINVRAIRLFLRAWLGLRTALLAASIGAGVNLSVYTDFKNGNKAHLIGDGDMARLEALVADRASRRQPIARSLFRAMALGAGLSLAVAFLACLALAHILWQRQRLRTAMQEMAQQRADGGLLDGTDHGPKN